MFGDLGSNLGYATDNFVTRDAGIDGIFPLVSRLVDVGVTDATKEDFNLDVSLAWLASSDVHRCEGVLGSGGSERADSHSAHSTAVW
jgi:hypothetical protein